VSGGTCHKIWDVDPVAKTATVWLDTLTTPQQMGLSEDGQMLFVTMATNPGDVLGIDVMTKATIFDYATLSNCRRKPPEVREKPPCPAEPAERPRGRKAWGYYRRIGAGRASLRPG
jgi:hypothetical protein